MTFEPKIAYNELDLLPPNINFETPKIYRQLIKTHRILAELKGYSEKLPNKNIILNSIVLQEAKDSSEIENIVTTHDELFKAISIKDIRMATQTKEVLNYREAIFKGIELIQEKKIKVDHPRIYSKELVEVLFSNVYTKISDLVDSGLASRNSASKYLKLFEPDILESKKIGKETIFINKGLYSLFKNG